MEKNHHILLIDGENILHQSFHKFERLHSTDGKPSGAIFGFFKSLHMYLTRFNPDKVIITFDNGRSKYRTDLLPDYKGHRKNIAIDYESLQSQKHIIMKILGMLRINYIFDKKKSTNYEGDDFLAYLILEWFKEDHVTLVSSDKDFNQLLRKHLKIYNPRKDELVYESNCQELFGYKASETVDYLTMVGDSSDDIKGIPGIGPVKARKLLDEYGSLADYFTKHTDEHEKIKIALFNTKLIDLKYFINEHRLKYDQIPMKRYKKKEIKHKKFKEICIEYSFASFLTNDFLKPFKNLNEK